ncbi:MAG: FecR domain-containing protein [Novosphingobium sp.]|nr:FecR domain-containing protein [Novosphingobium sp.]
MTAVSRPRAALLAGALMLGAAPLVLTALPGGALAVAGPQIVGIAAAIVNDVRIRASGAAQPRAAALRQRVALGDQVQTGRASRLQLQLLDRSVFTVGADARLSIDRFVSDPAGGSMTASVAKGAFRFMSGRSGSRGSAIGTPVATIGIRGTILDGVVGPLAVEIARGERGIGQGVEADPATATLVVLRGPGARRQGTATIGAVSVSAAGRTVDLDAPLQAAYVPRPGAPPIGPFTISLAGLARLNEMILPRQEPLLAVPQRDFYPPAGPYDNGPPPPYYRGPPPGDFPGGGFEGNGPRTRGPGPGYTVPGLPGNGGFGTPQGRPPREPRPERQAPSTSPTSPQSSVPATTGAAPNGQGSPTGNPSNRLYLPAEQPTSEPSGTPSGQPSGQPSGSPSASASPSPYNQTTGQPYP